MRPVRPTLRFHDRANCSTIDVNSWSLSSLHWLKMFYMWALMITTSPSRNHQQSRIVLLATAPKLSSFIEKESLETQWVERQKDSMASRLVLVLGDLFIPDRAQVCLWASADTYPADLHDWSRPQDIPAKVQSLGAAMLRYLLRWTPSSKSC